MNDTDSNELNRIARELTSIRTLVTQVVAFVRDAESEIPEKMRRFMNYMHDVHDIKYMYEEQGQPVPAYLMRELERLDDRYRQLLQDLHLDGGVFEKVRRDMAGDPENRFDHTRLLPKGARHEARPSDEQRPGGPEAGTDSPRDLGVSGGSTGTNSTVQQAYTVRGSGT